jgi:AcrR family transcriptional regulator
MKRTAKPKEPGQPPDTRERVLDVAEQLFSERGLDAVSVRDITSAAGANLGAINYHFGSKDELIRAVLERRISPVTQERFRRLDEVETEAGNSPPTLEAVLEAMFRGQVEQAMDSARGGTRFGKLMARCFMDPHPVVEQVLHEHFGPLAKRCDALLGRVMPDLDPQDIFWRMHLTIGALHHSLLMLDHKHPSGRSMRMDAESFLQKFVAYAAAGFRSEMPPMPKTKDRVKEGTKKRSRSE